MASQIKTLDKQWSLLVKYRAKYKCEVCGKGQEEVRLNSHHIVGRRNKRTRWNLRNGVCLCVNHHKFGIQSAHEDGPWFDKWLQKHRKKDYDYLNRIKNKKKEWKPSERVKLIEEFKLKIKKYERDGNIS